MEEAGTLWRQLPEDDRARYVSEFDELQEQEAAAGDAASSNVSVDVDALHHGVGDSEYLVTRAQVAPLCHKGTMKAKAQVWHQRYAGRIKVAPDVTLTDRDTPTEHRACGELYGARVCR